MRRPVPSGVSVASSRCQLLVALRVTVARAVTRRFVGATLLPSKCWVLARTTASVGLAGYTAQWDKLVDDVLNHATPGSGDSFYDGPQTQGSRGSLSRREHGLD